MIELRCIREADKEAGLYFTKGHVYDCIVEKDSGETFYFVQDDNGQYQDFWNLNIMFERV